MIERIFESTHKVRGYECDFYGHVNNANYLNFLEFARMELLEALGLTLVKLKAAGIHIVIRRVDIQYKFPAEYHEEIVIRTRMKGYTGATGTFQQQILRKCDEKLLADAEVTWACTNQEGRAVRMPQILRTALQIGGEKKRI